MAEEKKAVAVPGETEAVFERKYHAVVDLLAAIRICAFANAPAEQVIADIRSIYDNPKAAELAVEVVRARASEVMAREGN